MPTLKSVSKTANRSDRTVFAERRNRLERVRNEFQVKLLEREKARTRFIIGKERKEIAKRFQTIQQTTGVSAMGIPSSLHDKDVCNSQHYRCGQVISQRRLKQWRRQEDMLRHQVKLHEVKDEEAITDRQLVLNNLLAELRNEAKDVDEMRQRPNRPAKELRMPYAAHPSTLDVFESLRADVPEQEEIPVKPATAHVSHTYHNYDQTIEPETVSKDKSKVKQLFDIPRWEKEIKKFYMSRLLGNSRWESVDGRSARPASAPVFANRGSAPFTTQGTTGQSESQLFIRVNGNITGDKKTLKVRPHSATNHKAKSKFPGKERPKSSPHRGRTILRSASSTTTLTDIEGLAPPPAQENSRALTPPPQTSREKSSSPVSIRSGVSFASKTTVYNIETDDESTFGETEEDKFHDVLDDSLSVDANDDQHVEKADNCHVEKADECHVEKSEDHHVHETDRHNLEESDEDSQRIGDVTLVNELQIQTQTQSSDELLSEKGESEVPSKEPGPAIRKVAFSDPRKPIIRSMSRGQLDSRVRKISSSESLDMIRNKHLLINIDSRGFINKRLTGTDEVARPPESTGPPQWRRDLLRDAPPAVYSPAKVPKVYMTMSRSARRKELEKMVEQNTSNLRDMILSEKERRTQTRINLQKSMAELDTINIKTPI